MHTILRIATEVAVLGTLASASFVALAVVYSIALTAYDRWRERRFEESDTGRWKKPCE